MLDPRIRHTLRRRRLQLGMYQRQLAEKIGTHQSHISELELNEARNIRLDLLERWADALGLTVRIVLDLKPSRD